MNTSATDKKKVLLTINNNRLSGIEKFVMLLSKYLAKDNFSVVIGIPTYGSLCEVFKKEKIDYFIFNNGRNGKYTIKGIVHLFRHMRKNRYDIVHAQAGIPPCIIAKILKTGLVIEHKHGLDFTEEEINNMGIIKLNYERIKKYFTDYTLTGCGSDKLKLEEKFGYDGKKVITVYNGLEDSDYTAGKKNDGKIIIGNIGRLTYQKGQEYFIEMAKLLSSESDKYEFHIYGEGENYDLYSALIDKYKLNDKVFLKGYTNDVSEAMGTFDVFVLSSRYEGIPYVILEAMLNRVPVVTTNVGGINEVIENMKNGILVKKENPRELAEGVNLLLNDRNLYSSIVYRARKDFDEKYNIKITVRKIEEIYNLNKN